jgi:hypothetical protein
MHQWDRCLVVAFQSAHTKFLVGKAYNLPELHLVGRILQHTESLRLSQKDKNCQQGMPERLVGPNRQDSNTQQDRAVMALRVLDCSNTNLPYIEYNLRLKIYQYWVSKFQLDKGKV